MVAEENFELVRGWMKLHRKQQPRFMVSSSNVPMLQDEIIPGNGYPQALRNMEQNDEYINSSESPLSNIQHGWEDE